jgi:hypothetical protein
MLDAKDLVLEKKLENGTHDGRQAKKSLGTGWTGNTEQSNFQWTAQWTY